MNDWDRIGTRGVFASLTRMAHLFDQPDYREEIAALAQDRYAAGALVYGSSSWQKSDGTLVRERDEEVADMTIYEAMRHN